MKGNLITTSNPFSENFPELITISGLGFEFRKLELVDFRDKFWISRSLNPFGFFV